MTRPTTRDVTFVLRVWLEPGDHRPRARLLSTGEGGERTAVGATAVVALVESALAEFLDEGG